MISAQTKRTVRILYGFACGYCSVSEDEVGAQLTIDHFIPQSAGGTDEIDNLVYACFACNLHKSAAWDVENPPALHPLHCDLDSHYQLLPDDTLKAITPEGLRHIDTFNLNRKPLVELRQSRRMKR